MTRKPRGRKIGREWMTSWGGRQSQSLTELYLIVQGSVHLCPHPPLSKPPWSWGLNSAHLGNNIQIEIRREIRAKFSPTRSSFQAPTFLWRTNVIFDKGRKAIFNNENWIPLPTSIRTTASHRRIAYGATGRKADVTVSSHMLIFHRAFSAEEEEKQEQGRLLQPDWEHFPCCPRIVGFSLGEKKASDCPWNHFHGSKFQSNFYEARFSKKNTTE